MAARVARAPAEEAPLRVSSLASQAEAEAKAPRLGAPAAMTL